MLCYVWLQQLLPILCMFGCTLRGSLFGCVYAWCVCVCVCVCEFVITASVGGNKMTKNCRRSRIEVRPTALLRYHAHKPWTLTFDLKPMTLTFNPRRVMALTHSVGFCVWVPYTKPQVYKGQSLQKIEWKQTDGRTDKDRLHYLSRLAQINSSSSSFFSFSSSSSSSSSSSTCIR